jgi:hypothetical protein
MNLPPETWPKLPPPNLTAPVTPESERSWVLPVLSDFMCTKRRLRLVDKDTGLADPKLIMDQDTRAAFAGAPLVSLGLDDHVAFLARDEQKKPPVSSQLPFDVSGHPQAKSAVAGFMMERLEAEMKHYADLQNNGKIAKYKGLLDQDIESYARYVGCLVCGVLWLWPLFSATLSPNFGPNGSSTTQW